MVGCHRVRSRRLVRVLGTAAAATAAVLCVGARVAPPVLGVQAGFDTPDKPRPSASAVPTATPKPTLPPSPEPTPRPEPTPVPTPVPTAPPHASPRPTAPAPAPASAAPVVAPPAAAPSPPPPAASPQATARPLPTPHATPSLVTVLSALPAAVAGYAQDSRGNTSPYVVGADAMAGVAVTSSLALATLRRRGLL